MRYPLLELFDSLRARNDDVFIIWREQPISSAQFLERVEALQREFDGLGIRSLDGVGVTGFEGWMWITAMVAVWAAGAVYVPLPDPDDAPRATGTIKWLVSISSEQSLDIRRVESATYHLFPDGAAYLIPTSGSTREPRWIVGALDGLLNFVNWERSELQIEPSDIIALLTPPTFDPVFRDVLLPMISGARLAIPDAGLSINAPALLTWLEAARVTVVHIVPSIARTWRLLPLGNTTPWLKHVLLAGEPLFWSDVIAIQRRLGDEVAIYNLYGPSETTMAACAFRCARATTEQGSVPVGRAIDGYAVIVLDDAGNICSSSEVGEVYIRAAYPSLGYLSDVVGEPPRPDGFVTNPLAMHDRTLLFRTGDLGRIDDLGLLTIVGRIDDAYKVRGVKVHMTAIEAALRSIEGVREAAVRVWEDLGGPSIIAAYLETTQPLDVIRRAAVERLPVQAIPQYWALIDNLPRTASGKTDRTRLPRPVLTTQSSPFTGGVVLDALLALWRETIPFAEGVGIDDTFFSLGGKSIEAVQIVLGIEERLRVHVDLADIYSLQTIRNIAAHIEVGMEHGEQRARSHAVKSLGRGDVPLTGAQERFWRWMKIAGNTSCFQFTFCSVLRGDLDFDRLAEVVHQLVVGNDAFTVDIQATDSGAVVLKHSMPSYHVPIIDRADIPGGIETVRRLVVKECGRPFQFGREPLMRPMLIRLGEREGILALTNHVLASDGWTRRLLLRQLTASYTGSEPPRPAMTFMEAATLEADQRYRWDEYTGFWAAKYRSLVASSIPYDKRPPRLATRQLGRVSRSMDPVRSRSLLARAAEFQLPIETVFLAATAHSLAVWSTKGETHLLISNAKRLDPRLNAVIGCFTDSMIYDHLVEDDPVLETIRAQDRCGECLRNSIPSFLFLMDKLRPDIDHTSPYWLPVIFAPQNDYRLSFDGGSIAASAVNWQPAKSIWPVEVYPVLEPEDELRLVINYAAEMFQRATIEKFAALIMERVLLFGEAGVGK